MLTFETFEIEEKIAISLKRDFYESGRYQDNETLQFVYPLSNGTFLISESTGRRQFLLQDKHQLNIFNSLLKPTTNPDSSNVYIRMNNFSLSLVDDKIDSLNLIKSSLDLRFNLKIEKNDLSFENLDKQIKHKILQSDNEQDLRDMLFLIGLYLCESLKINNKYIWKLKLKLRLPQYYVPNLYKPGKNHVVGFWPIIVGDLEARKVIPISYMLKLFQR